MVLRSQGSMYLIHGHLQRSHSTGALVTNTTLVYASKEVFLPIFNSFTSCQPSPMSEGEYLWKVLKCETCIRSYWRLSVAFPKRIFKDFIILRGLHNKLQLGKQRPRVGQRWIHSVTTEIGEKTGWLLKITQVLFVPPFFETCSQFS